ncbi:PAAR-like protein [Pedobacter sp. UYP1]|jgi:hypothetical protein|uniref:PAAR-like protein n=1 Tax=Pedobacter sp. UYP1 TaxID=1756396 RepID=UPI0033992B97
MAKKYVPDGVYLVCNKGLGFCKLKVTNHKSVSLFGNNSATEADKLPNVNIGCMGVCSVTKSICQPLPTLWSGVQESITIGPYRKLLEDSKLGCGLGGQISIYFTLPDAMSAINKNSSAIKSAGIKNIGAKVDDWFQKQFDAQEKINNAGPVSGLANFKLGLSEGVYGGIKGIGEGLVFLGELENKVIDAGIDAALHPVETAGKIKDAAIATKDATAKAYDWVTNEDNLKKTAQAVGEAHRNAYNWVTTPGNLEGAAKTALTKTGEGLKQAKDWAVKQNPRDWGRYTGRGGFEAALMFTGVGEVKAVVSGAEAVNVAAKVGEGANVLAKTGEAVNLAEKATEGANLLDKAVDAKRLGEVVSKSADDLVKEAMNKFDPLTMSAKQKGNFGEMVAKKNMTENPLLKKKGYDLKRIGDEAPTGLDDKIKKGIDGIYENASPPPKFVIDEAKYGTSQLSKGAKDGAQMSDGWIKGSKRLEKQVGPKKAREIERALKNNEVDRVLSKVDDTGKVTTYNIDKSGNIGTLWP